MQECDEHGEWLCTLCHSGKFGAQKDCSTSFDVAILINTLAHLDFRKLKTMIQNCINMIAMI